MRSISRFILGLVLVMVGLFTVGAGVARAQSTATSIYATKADACLLQVKNSTINLDRIVYINIGGANSVHFWYPGNSGTYVSLGSNDPATDLARFTSKWRACLNAK